MYRGRKCEDPYTVDCSGFQSLKQRLDRYDEATMRQLATLRNEQFDVEGDDLENDETPVSLFGELDLDFVDLQHKLEALKVKCVSVEQKQEKLAIATPSDHKVDKGEGTTSE